MCQQLEPSDPAAQQRGLVGGLRRLGLRGLLGQCLLVGDGGAVVQLGVDEALAPADVVHAARQRPLGPRQRPVGQRVAGRLLGDGGDTLVAEVPVQRVLTWGKRERGTWRCLLYVWGRVDWKLVCVCVCVCVCARVSQLHFTL